MIRHLLVTNDFPPKVGGIQSYLWELWRRLPADDFAVLTSPHPAAGAFDAEQAFEIHRTPEPVLLPSPVMTKRVEGLADRFGAAAVVLDPAVPLGLTGPSLSRPYAAVLHGAEVTVPARLPVTRPALARVLRRASLLISAGGYPEAEARRAEPRLPPVVHVPPGVDVDRFVPVAPEQKSVLRSRLGLPADGPLILSVSRLVPRKGMDVLIESAARLRSGGRWPGLTVAVAGAGRDRSRLERLVARSGAPVRFLGRVPEEQLPSLYAAADIFVLCCRTRWGGLEQEGFGIVFLEAAAAGVPAVAGSSGGAAEAVEAGRSGLLVEDPRDAGELTSRLAQLLSDPQAGAVMGREGRRRAVEKFSYDVLARRLEEGLDGLAPAGGTNRSSGR